MNKQVVQDIILAVKPELITALIYALVIGFIILLLKSILESCVAYALFIYNSELGPHVRVILHSRGGLVGEITKYHLGWITIRTKTGIELVYMKRWQQEKWGIVFSDLNGGQQRGGNDNTAEK
ncbi:MAG TPA: hypothetical protein ENH62_14845 [Marinobacter sp.]|uniref:Uncharacterized protein n=1 Tax=marine sediment metagenome TaxID=412755 RepID=A0A0F9PIS5_9ZZZZ|nr:hypothetical protein [Marinobacter sp.]